MEQVRRLQVPKKVWGEVTSGVRHKGKATEEKEKRVRGSGGRS